jgi:ribosomal protein S18 acetylase RimI-like enzyme
MRLTCEDWRHSPQAQILPLYAVETSRWATLLEWDTTTSWQEVEHGRQLGTVPGLLVTGERNEVVGWSYYIVHNQGLQIGGFISSSEACTAVMLERILEHDGLEGVQTITFFALTDAPGLALALRGRGLAVNRYWYMARDSTPGAPLPLPWDVRQWRLEDIDPTAELLMRAYATSDETRPFAPRGTSDEWSEYVFQLVHANGCGELMLSASVCVPAGPGRLAAVALVSRIGPTTGHLVQLVVDPRFQKRGFGSSLLDAACGAAARAGCRRMTLLVSGRNDRARRLYDGARFEAVASFVSGGSIQPRRSTSVAPGVRDITFR